MSIRHDYKSATTGQRRQRARRYGLLVMTLVLIGLFGGALAYIRGDRTRLPVAAASAPATPAQPLATPAQPTAALPPLKPVTLSVAEPETVKPKYDFYTELPKRKIPIQRETVKPANAPRPAPTRMQPAANQLQKPATPRRNAISSPTMTTAGGAKPDSKAANPKTANPKTASTESATSKTATSKTATSKTTRTESANPKTATSKTTRTESANPKTATSKTTTSKTTTSKTATSKTTNSTPANSRSATVKTPNPEPANSRSTPTNSRPATTKPTPATAPTRTAQPLRPFTNNNSKIVVKTEQEP